MKPIQVLEHFMSMFVDNASSVLDLTAGSGSSLLVAHQLQAKRIVGLEISEETYSAAVNFLNEREAVVSL
jgi:DNA modification methylase